MRCMLKLYAKKDVMNSSKTSKNSKIGIAKSGFLHGLRNGDVKCTINNTSHKHMRKFRISGGITICRNI